MIVTGSAKMSVAYSIVGTPPASSIATVRTAVSTAQKMRSHFGPSCDGSGIETDKEHRAREHLEQCVPSAFRALDRDLGELRIALQHLVQRRIAEQRDDDE